MISSGLLTADQLSQASIKADEKGVPLPRYVAEAGMAARGKVYEALAEVYGVPYMDVANFEVSADALRAVPADLAHRYKAMPLFKIEHTLTVAMENPTDVSAIDHLRQKSGCEIDVCLAPAEDIEGALKEHYGSATAVTQLLESLSKERRLRSRVDPKARSGGGRATGSAAGGTSVVELVDLLIRQAYEEGASDIHIEPEEKMLRVRYRVDGVLHEAAAPPKELESEIITRIKILAEMDIAENRLPQDGRIKMKLYDNQVDMRVSSVPTVYGENLVIRLLKDSSAVLDLPSLGFSSEMQKIFEGLIHRPYGMILETGPTGSGKTTTLYAAMNMINTVERNIVTIEDPVEYKLPMIRQIPVNVKAGLTFATALRSMLRQDPDVIMVGEIRDRETAEIAIQAALTGHLVFSTLHTNNAASVVTRLADMKIEPFLIASSLLGVISQRLVRRICEKCRVEDKPSAVTVQALKVPTGRGLTRCFKGKGCRHCQHTGTKGRVGIFEMLQLNEAIQKKIMTNASSSDIEQEARKGGFKNLLEDAFDKVEAGIVSIEEVVKWCV